MIKREKYLNKITEKLNNNNKILFLIWARQVWKTTLLQGLVKYKIINWKNTFFLYWDEISSLWIQDYQWFIEYIQIQKSLKTIKYLILDEAQYIKNIWLILKILIDKIRIWDFNFKIIVSWSWSLNIFSGITDSLIGRKNIIHVMPFSFEEFLLTKEINFTKTQTKWITEKYLSYFQEYILFGWYPDVIMAKDKETKFNIFKSIFDDYIFKDVSLLLENKDIIKFKQFLKLIASKIWNYISISTLVEELWVSRYILEKYMFVVENTFLLQKINPRIGWKFQNEIKKKHKIYFNDIGMLRYLLWMSERVWDFKWKIIENFVCNQILLSKQNYQELFFWWTFDGWEVDFVLEDQVKFKITPIEVKSWNKTNIPKSFSNFYEKYENKITKWIITTENTSIERWNIKIIPYIYISESITT